MAGNAETIFALQYNQEPIQTTYMDKIGPGSIAGKILAVEEWPAGVHSGVEEGNLEIFRTPLDNMPGLGHELRAYDDRTQTVVLGELTTRVASGKDIAIELETGHAYDIFCMARSGKSWTIEGGSRYAVTDDENYTLRHDLTFEETKFMALMALGLTVEQAKKVEARVIPGAGYPEDLSRARFMYIAGFELLLPQDHELARYQLALPFADTALNEMIVKKHRQVEATAGPGVIVDDRGGVQYLGGRTREATFALAGLERVADS